MIRTYAEKFCILIARLEYERSDEKKKEEICTQNEAELQRKKKNERKKLNAELFSSLMQPDNAHVRARHSAGLAVRGDGDGSDSLINLCM